MSAAQTAPKRQENTIDGLLNRIPNSNRPEIDRPTTWTTRGQHTLALILASIAVIPHKAAAAMLPSQEVPEARHRTASAGPHVR